MLGLLRRHRDFRQLWLSQVVSQAGDWLGRIAVLTLIGQLGGETTATIGLGGLFAVELGLRMLPTVLTGPIAGPVADRLPRRLLMVVSDVLRAVIVLGLLLVREPEQLPWLYALIAAQMSVGVFFEAARSAALPSTVPHADLHDAFALSAVTWSIMLTLGALTGGVLTALLGIRAVFVVDALSYLLSALLLIGLHLPRTVQATPFHWRDIVLLADMRRGLAHARSRSLGPVLLAKTFWGPVGGFLVLLSLAGHELAPELAGESVGAGAGVGAGGAIAGAAGLATGLLFCARGLGTGVGPVLSKRILGSSDRALRRQVALGFLVALVGYAAFGGATHIATACACVAFAHVGGSTLWVASSTWWQRHVDDAFRGRVFALDHMGMTLSLTVFSGVAGWVYDASGSVAVATWALCGLLAVLGAAWTLLARRSARG